MASPHPASIPVGITVPGGARGNFGETTQFFAVATLPNAEGYGGNYPIARRRQWAVVGSQLEAEALRALSVLCLLPIAHYPLSSINWWRKA
jgi:hypothetical protein